ncbi:MAG: FAD-dependent oxidoreductase [Leptospiraceae bacterium]|nr:FAD-dependent oxidoreductase [Leptospiraceae bacterium]MDW7976073.1 FAD-dependent oxidoreductase [Leptospiraceae bacterium]
MGKNVIEIQAQDYEKYVLQSDKPVILDFYSDECVPCEALAPKYEELSEIFGDKIVFLKMWRQKNRELALSLGVRSSPTLIFYQPRGKEVGKRLTGGIKKKEIIEQISNLIGEEEVKKRLSQKPKKRRDVDVIVLGGGPTGLTAGLYLAQAKLDTIIIDQDLPGGQVKITHMISNFPGTGGPISGWELGERMQKQVREAGAEIISAVDVTKVKLQPRDHVVWIDDDLEIHGKAIILAMGSEPRKLKVPGEEEYKGHGISYCATCDGKYYEGKEVVVVGGGNSAVEESLFLTKFVNKVTIVHQFDHLQANKTAQEQAFQNPKIHFVWNSEPRAFEKLPDGRMKVTIENVKTKEYSDIITDGVFIFVGYVPNLSIIEEDLAKDKWGYLITDEDMRTSIEGVFAAGDLRSKKYRQVTISVGEGTIAAMSCERYIAELNHELKKEKDLVLTK